MEKINTNYLFYFKNKRFSAKISMLWLSKGIDAI